MLATRFPSNFFVKLLGVWEVRSIFFYHTISLPPLLICYYCSP
jgi:hypothetical protein